MARNIIEDLYPRANTPGRRVASGQTIDNYVINPEQRRRDDQFDVRVDHAFTTANRAFLRYSLQNAWRRIPPSLPLGDGSPSPGTYDTDAQSLAVNDTHIFGPGVMNELRVGWSAIDIGNKRVGFGENIADQMGIPGINRDELTSGMVTIGFATQDMRGVGSGGGPGTINTSAFQVTDSVTSVRGRHTLKAGGSLILRKRHVYFSDTPLGLYAHRSELTSSCAGSAPGCVPAPNTGFGFAGFMIGAPDIFFRSMLEAPYTERRPEVSAFVQDDLRLGNRLTLNLGLRWDLFVPYVEDDDRQSNFDTATGQFVVASPGARIGGIEVGRYLQTYSKTDFAPRLGFAFDLLGTGATMLRGGFGTFWNTPLTGTGSSKGQNPPFLLAQQLTNPTPYVPVLTFASSAAPPTPQTGGNSRSSFDPNFRDGYAHQWSLNLQQQLGTNYMVEAGYVGSRGRQMVTMVDVNQAPATLGVTNPNVNRPFFGVNPALAAVVQSQSRGTLDYHGLLTRVVRRFAGGTSFSASYTFGKAIDLSSDTDGGTTFPNPYDLGYNRGPANYDVTHVLTATGIYTVPFWRDRWFGGWQLSGLLLARSGYPFSVFQSNGPQSTIASVPPGSLFRPDRIGSGLIDEPTVDRWFDTSAFRCRARRPRPTGMRAGTSFAAPGSSRSTRRW